MKKLVAAILMTVLSACTFGAFADDFGVVNMQTIFKTAPQAKAINDALKTQFASRKEHIVAMGKQLQTEIKQYQKNQSVMDKKAAQALQQKISQQSITLRKAQAKFQSDLVAAQNQKMKQFLENVKTAVQKVAKKKDLEMVFPSNAVLYSANDLDVTSDVLSAMK